MPGNTESIQKNPSCLLSTHKESRAYVDKIKYIYSSDDEKWMANEYVPRLVSVIIPTYNRAHLIQNSLNSVVQQTYRPIELIVVDDGSSDNTEEVFKKWLEENDICDVLIKYIKTVNGGAPRARNIGLQNCSGQFIQYLDSDDYIAPEKLCAHVAVLFKSGADFVWSNSQRTETRVESFKKPDPDKAVCYVGKKKLKFPTQIVKGLFRRQVCQRVGPWNIKLQRYQDWEYGVRAISHCRKIAFLDWVGYIVLDHKSGRISDGENKNFARKIVRAVSCLDCSDRTLMKSFVRRYKCSQALVSASVLFINSGSYRCAKSTSTRARREAPISFQWLKAAAVELYICVRSFAMGFF